MLQPPPGPPPVASVLLATHNGADTIAAALAAFAGQVDAPPFEVLVLDDNSTDGTAEVARRALAGLDGRVIPARGAGLVAARDQLADAAASDLLLFCDDDDEVGPRWVAAHVEALATHEVSTGPLEPWCPDAPWMVQVRKLPDPDRVPVGGHLPYATGCNFGVRRAVLAGVGGWGEICPGEDLSLSWRIQEAGGRIGHHPDARVRYRLRSDLRSLWRQQISYAMGQKAVDRAHGVRPSPTRLRIHGWLLRHVTWAWSTDPVRRSRFVMEAATAWGRLRGAVRHGTVPW